MYREAGVQMPAVINTSISIYIKDSHWMEFLYKQNMGLRLNDVNNHMTKEVYSKILKEFSTVESKNIFSAHLFFILDW